MNRARPFAGLILLAVLAAGASPEVHLVQVARGLAPPGPDRGLLNRASSGEPLPLASRPADQARREPASVFFEDFSGGSAGTFLIGAALLAAAALLLAVVIPW